MEKMNDVNDMPDYLRCWAEDLIAEGRGNEAICFAGLVRTPHSLLAELPTFTANVLAEIEEQLLAAEHKELKRAAIQAGIEASDFHRRPLSAEERAHALDQIFMLRS